MVLFNATFATNLANGVPNVGRAVRCAKDQKISLEVHGGGLKQLVLSWRRGLGASPRPPPQREENRRVPWAEMAAEIGGWWRRRLARNRHKADQSFDSTSLRAVRRIVGEVGGEEGRLMTAGRGGRRESVRRSRSPAP